MVFFSFVVAFAPSFFVFEISPIVGTRNLRNILLGRHHRPRVEERFFLFVDVEGSASLDERIGPAAVHPFWFRLTPSVDSRPPSGTPSSRSGPRYCAAARRRSKSTLPAQRDRWIATVRANPDLFPPRDHDRNPCFAGVTSSSDICRACRSGQPEKVCGIEPRVC